MVHERKTGDCKYTTFSISMLCYYTYVKNASLLNLLSLGIQLDRYWLAPQPDGHKGQPSHDGDADTAHPWPGRADLPGTWELVVCEVADGHGVLLLDVGEEGALVVDLEVEDTVLVWQGEAGGVDRAVGR
jgi:hypothetical protein